MRKEYCSKCSEPLDTTHKAYCRLCFNEYKRAYRSKLPAEKKLAASSARSERYIRDREHERALNRAWLLANATRRRSSRMSWYEGYREKAVAYSTAWQRANPDKVRLYRALFQSKRRARRAGGHVSAGDWRAIKQAHGNRCHYCGTRAAPMTMDHFYPLSRGGAHDPKNIVPACRNCNLRKSNTPPEEFALKLGRLCW